MADSRYLIDIILKARDDTATAVQSAIAKMNALETQTKRNQQEAEKLGERYDRAFSKMEEANRSLKRSEEDLIATRNKLKISSDEAIKKQIDLEDAAKNYTRTLKAQGEEAKETVLAHSRMIAAQKDLIDQLKEEKVARAAATAQAVKDAAVRVEQASIQAEAAREVARAEEESARRRAQANEELEALRRNLHEREMQRNQEEIDAKRENYEHQQRLNQQRREDEEALQEHLREMHERTVEEQIALEDERYEREQQRNADRRKSEEETAALRLHLARREAEAAREEEAAKRATWEHQQAREQERREMLIATERARGAASAQAEREYQNALRETIAAKRAAAEGRTGRAPERIQTQLDADVAEAMAKLEAAAVLIRQLDGKEIDVRLDLDTASFTNSINHVKRDIKETEGGVKGIGAAFGSLFDGVDNGSNRIAAFDNLIRGLFTLGITVFLQQIVQAAGAAAGMLMALASSAAQAGAALGGALAAGAAQALPVLGVLGTAISRLTKIFEAVKQANNLQEQQSYKSANAERTQANAADAVADAERRVTDARKRLTEARAEAIRQLRDLILAEREAELAARGASLSQEEAQQALQRAIASGSGVARAQLSVDESDLGVTKANQRLAQVRGDARRGREEGPEGSKGVQAAKEALRDAERGLVRARRSADQANEATSAAAGKLAFLLAGMTAAERRLFTALQNLQERFQGFARNVSEPLIIEFTRMAKRVTDILKPGGIIEKTAGSLASGMAKSFGRVFDAFTGGAGISQIVRIANQAKQNFKPLTDIIINLGKAFFNIAEAAGPSFNRLLTWISDLTERFRDFTTEGRKSGELGQFFQEGVSHLQSWLKLMGAIVKLFFAISGAGGADAGKKAVDDMAGSISNAADRISTAGTKANKFWRDFFKTAREMMDALGPIFTSLGNEFKKTFNNDGVNSVKGFSAIMAEVLIPGLGRFVRSMGHAVAAVGDFVRANPAIAKISAGFLALALTMGTVGKIGSVFSPLTHFLRNLGNVTGATGKLAAATKGLLGIFGAPFVAVFTRIGRIVNVMSMALAGSAASGGRFAGILTRIMGIGAGPFALIAGALVVLLARFGKLDDVGRAITKMFRSIYNQVKEPFKGLVDSVGVLVESFNGTGGLIPILQEVVNFIGDVLVVAFEMIGDVAGPILSNLIEVAEGIIDALSALIRLDFGDFIAAIGKIGKAIVEGLFGALAGIGKGLLKIFILALEFVVTDLVPFVAKMGLDLVAGYIKALTALPRLLLGVFRDAFNGVKNFLSDLPGNFVSIGERIAKAIAGGIKKLPGMIGDLFGAGGKMVKSIVGSIMKFLNDKGPFGDDIAPGPLTVRLPKLPENFNAGGPVPGTGSRDTVPAMLTPGEHVWTAAEVARAGGHKVMFALRALLGGGTAGGPRRFALGGPVRPNAQAQTSSVNVDADTDGFAHRWRLMWREVTNSTRRNTALVEAQIRQMRVNIENTMTRLSREFHLRWERMSKFAIDKSHDLWLGVRENIMNLQSTVYRGMSYVGGATNDALKAFDAEPVNLSVRRPSGMTGRASGGWIGNSGERGKDEVPVWLGRGEAVLNWAHQKVVNSALWNQYGTTLDGLFNRSTALHAGGKGDAVGLAGGGRYGGPGQSGEGFTPVWNLAKKKFGMTYFTGFQGHNMMTSSGNVSDHYRHAALDMGNGPSPTPGMDALNQFFKTKLPQVVKQLIWRDKDQFNGYPIGGHMDHVHLAMKEPFAFNSSLMAKLISRAARGLSISALVRGLSGDENLSVDHIDRLRVRGIGPLKNLIQKVMDKVRSRANKFLDKQAGEEPFGVDTLGLHGEPYDGPLDRRFPKHFAGEQAVQLTPGQVAGLAERAGLPGRTFAQIAHGESNYYPGVQQRDPGDGMVGYGLWQMTPNAWGIGSAAVKFMQSLGGIPAMFNPWKNALMAKFLYKAAGNTIRPWYGTRYVTAASGGYPHGLPEFARGGIVPGAVGQPVPIMAHAREWVLNQMQQGKLAGMLGTSIGKLKDMLGFTGGPTSFAGGGEPVGGQGYQFYSARSTREEENHERRMASLKGKNREDERKAEEKRHKERMAQIKKEEAEARKTFKDLLPNAQRMSNINRGRYEGGLTPSQGVEGIDTEISRARRAMRRLGSARGEGSLMGQLIKNITALTGEDGLFDQMRAALERRTKSLATTLSLARAGFRVVAGRLKSSTPLTDDVAIAIQEAKNLEEIGKELRSLRGKEATELRRINNQINTLSRGGITEKERAQYQELIAQRIRVTDTIAGLDSDIAQNSLDRFEKLKDAFEAGTAQALEGAEANSKISEYTTKLGSLLGNSQMVEMGAKGTLDALTTTQGILESRLAAAQEAAKTNPAMEAVVKDLAEKVAAGTYSIAEARAKGLTDAIAAVDKEFANRTRLTDLQGRASDLMERSGNALGAAQGRINTSQEVFRNNGAQLGEYERLRREALAMGNVGAAKELQDKIDDLTQAMDENEQTTRDLIAQYRTTATEIIQGRADSATGFIGTAQGIIDKVNAIASTNDPERARQNAERIGEVLRGAAGELVANINQSLGQMEFTGDAASLLTRLRDSFEKSPLEFADVLAEIGPQLSSLEANMAPAARASFRALIDSLINNTTATLDNTESVQNLDSSYKMQEFSSSAWQMFRSAIFNGMGGLLPTYQIPQMHTGGYVTKAGVFDLSVGERVLRPDQQVGGDVKQEINLTVNKDIEEADALSIAKRTAWELKSANTMR